MFSPEMLTFLTILIYLAASFTGITGLIWRKQIMRAAGRWLSLGAFGCQTLILVFGFHRLLPQGLTMGAYLQLLAWFFLLVGIAAWLRMRQDVILLLAAPLGLLLFLISAPWINLPLHLPAYLSASFYALHTGALFLALGLLALAFTSSILFLILNKRIKAKKKMSGVWEDIPALSALEKTISFCALACYPLYTIGLAAGFVWSRPVFGRSFSGDPKEIVSILIWLLLTFLFYSKVVRNWKGKKPAMLIIAIFALSLFSIVCVNLFLPTHHGFIR